MSDTIQDLVPIKDKHQYLDYLRMLSNYCELREDQLNEYKQERIKHLSILLEAYESEIEDLKPTDPIAIIRIRMHERGLSPADVIQYFGSRSRVSEVLNGRRKLTLSMIRNISSGLDIPAEFLIGVDESASPENPDEPDWALFPIAEMYKRGWIKAKSRRSKNLKQSMQDFFDASDPAILTAAYKRSITLRSESISANYARTAWLSRVVSLSNEVTRKYNDFRHSYIDDDFLAQLAAESQNYLGHINAFNMLKEIGVVVVYEPTLKGASIDGAATEINGTPIIGITLRHDRLDNFWFTLLHEVCHVWKHLDTGQYLIDDFDMIDDSEKIEAEANRVARDTLIPRSAWRRSAARVSPTVPNVLDLAREVGRDPAIVAGRVRREKNNYSLFADLVGSGHLRKTTKRGVQ